MNKTICNNIPLRADERVSTMNHPTAITGSSRSMDTVTVWCGCRPKAKRNRRKYRKIGPSSSERWWKRRMTDVNTKYEGLASIIRQWMHRDPDGECKGFRRNDSSVDGRDSSKSSDNQHEDLYFFDAVDLPLRDDEYPITERAIGAQNVKVVLSSSRVDSVFLFQSRTFSSNGSDTYLEDFNNT